MLMPLFTVGALLLSSLSTQEPAATPAASAVPTAAAEVTNPVKPTPESLARAKKMYGYDCAMCHGENGNGKGDLVTDMKLVLKDYSDPGALKDLSDGEIFSILKSGKGQMTGEGDRAKPGDLWNLVNLLRSFARK